MFRRLVAAPFTLVAARRLRASLRVGRPRAFRSSRSAAGGARPSAAPRTPRSASPPCGRFPCRAVPRSRPLPRCSPSLGLGRGAAPLALRRPCPRPRLGRRDAGRRPPRYAGRRGLLARVSWPSPSALRRRIAPPPLRIRRPRSPPQRLRAGEYPLPLRFIGSSSPYAGFAAAVMRGGGRVVVLACHSRGRGPCPSFPRSGFGSFACGARSASVVCFGLECSCPRRHRAAAFPRARGRFVTLSLVVSHR